MALDRKSLIGKFELRLILIANRTIPSLSLWRLIHNKDILLLLLLIYITSGTQVPKTLTHFEKENPRQGDSQITVIAPETDCKRNTTKINGT